MTFNVNSAIAYTWAALGIVWLIGVAFSKPTAHSQAWGPRLFHMAVALLGFTLLAGQYFRQGWLGMRLLPNTQAVDIAGFVLTLAGCAFAVWARVQLGSNWSGRAVIKTGHELIVSGPYALSRHPIYTGLLLAATGTALARAEGRCLLGLVLILLALFVKMSQEELLMMQAFPRAYPAYRHRVKALIPGIF